MDGKHSTFRKTHKRAYKTSIVKLKSRHWLQGNDINETTKWIWTNYGASVVRIAGQDGSRRRAKGVDSFDVGKLTVWNSRPRAGRYCRDTESSSRSVANDTAKKIKDMWTQFSHTGAWSGRIRGTDSISSWTECSREIWSADSEPQMSYVCVRLLLPEG